MKLSLKNLGRVGASSQLGLLFENKPGYKDEVLNIVFTRYMGADWGDLCDEDKKLNDEAVITDDGRTVARYGTSEGDIYIITYLLPGPDRYTMIMFCNEY